MHPGGSPYPNSTEPRLPAAGGSCARLHRSTCGPDGKFPEGLLAGLDLPQQGGRVERRVQLAQPFLDLFRHVGGCQHPLVGGLGHIIAFHDLGAVPDLLDQHHDRLEEVEIQTQGLVECVKGRTGGLAFVAVVADVLPHGLQFFCST